MHKVLCECRSKISEKKNNQNSKESKETCAMDYNKSISSQSTWLNEQIVNSDFFMNLRININHIQILYYNH